MPLPKTSRTETGQLAAASFNTTTPDGFVFNDSPTGRKFQDERQYPFPALITGDGFGSGSGPAALPVSGFYYDWVEAFPALVDGEFGLFEKHEPRRSGTSDARPAVEANRSPDVAIGTVVYLYPGHGEPDFYYFWAPAAVGSGSGEEEIWTDCDGDGIAESCWKLRYDATGKPYYGPCDDPVAAPPSGSMTPQECYEKCIADKGPDATAACAAECGYTPPSQPLSPGTGGGGGGFGPGGF